MLGSSSTLSQQTSKQLARKVLSLEKQEQKGPPLESVERDKADTTLGKMSAIRALCRNYRENDIYNMDESLLSWKHVQCPALAPELMRQGTQMTLALCVNSTGTDKLPAWVITSEKKPISLDVSNPETFGAAWKSSESMLMTSGLMQEWLLYFYSHIGNKRSVILLLDNVHHHKEGLKSSPPPSNIRIQWLPPGTTKRYQPLDQGINRVLKNHYRQLWLKRVFQNLYDEEPINPIHTMSSELAVHWLAQIWKHEVTNKTIQNSFDKSTLLQPRQLSIASKDLPDFRHSI